MKRSLFLVCALMAYPVALANIVYIVGFLADLGVPKTINDGKVGPLWWPLFVDVALVLGFGLHHSITARASFKRIWTRVIPAPIERATYLYMTALTTFIVVYCWQPIPVTVWRIDQPAAEVAIRVAYLFMWAVMFGSTFHFGHLGFFGVRQAWQRFRRRKATSASFSARYLYGLVRHPISLGWMLTPWLTPHMTQGQLVWAVAVTAYVLIATKFEEADLVEELGQPYRDYRTQVPAFFPSGKRIRFRAGAVARRTLHRKMRRTP